MNEVITIPLETFSEIKYVKQYPYVGEDGIYVPCQEYAQEGYGFHHLLISKEMFVEAYNKWIKGVDCDDGK